MGGKAIPEANPVTIEDFNRVIDNINHTIPDCINIYTIGSAGKKPVASDIDILLDEDELNLYFFGHPLKSKLHHFFLNQQFFAKISGAGVHVAVESNKKIFQVDFMICKNAKEIADLHTHDYSKDASQSGGQIHRILADLISIAPNVPARYYMISPYKGLVVRETNELVSTKKDDIAKAIFGVNSNKSDISSISSIKSKIINIPEFKPIYEKYFHE